MPAILRGCSLLSGILLGRRLLKVGHVRLFGLRTKKPKASLLRYDRSRGRINKWSHLALCNVKLSCLLGNCLLCGLGLHVAGNSFSDR